MRASKSQTPHLTPAKLFGLRLRELRDRRGWKQGELADRAGFDRTTVNKIEKGTRSDVSISQLFKFAEVLGTSPINLLTPGSPDSMIELSLGGRVVSGSEARGWIRGTVAPPGVDEFDWFFDLPIDEQRQRIKDAATSGGRHLLAWVAGGPEAQEAHIAEALERLEGARKEKKK